MFVLLMIESFDKFSLRILKVETFCSTNVTLCAPLDIHSMPKDPTPEYKSKICEFLIFVFIKFECSKILNIFSFTESLRGLVIKFFM